MSVENYNVLIAVGLRPPHFTDALIMHKQVGFLAVHSKNFGVKVLYQSIVSHKFILHQLRDAF